MKTQIVLLGLNELNFDYIKYYIKKGKLNNFKKLFDIQKPVETKSEDKYKLLEPWIQWVTVHTGKSFKEHKVFRLGDIVNRTDLPQLFEELESKGLKVGAISPFNADNRLKNPAFFIPDPWTITKASGNKIEKALYQAVHQSVNDNAKDQLKIKSIVSIGLGLLLYVPIKRWPHYAKTAFNAKKPGSKAIILDSLLSDIFFKSLKIHKPNFSNLFLNSGAHIQHHYLFNSEAYDGEFKNPEWYCPKGYDPLIKILTEYDEVIGRLLRIKGLKLIVATGLHQQPHKHLTFYWRLKDHVKFAKLIGLENFIDIVPRMSRDFLITFNNETDSKNAEKFLNSFKASIDHVKIFEVDNRGNSLFVELVYPNDIDETSSIYSDLNNFKLENFKSFLAFVAIKNGEHNGIGYLTSNFTLDIDKEIELSEVKNIVMEEALS